MHDEHLMEFYAGLAMLGMLSASRKTAGPEQLARNAFDIAEAMLQERNHRKERSVNGR